jgi:hypothetical protein
LGRPASVTIGGITTTFRHDALGRKMFQSLLNSTIGRSLAHDSTTT